MNSGEQLSLEDLAWYERRISRTELEARGLTDEALSYIEQIVEQDTTQVVIITKKELQELIAYEITKSGKSHVLFSDIDRLASLLWERLNLTEPSIDVKNDPVH